ncbi:MAG TPA: serine/threonine-protein kinase [Pyrinomonadaceae bacterium]|nr:serine/threonine-protein kinase [Pyrinomonadaceae bacterium]
MTPERWQTVEETLQAALDCPASQRADLLAKACAGDADLQRETTSLLEAHEAAGDFLEQSALERDAQLLIDSDDRQTRAGTAIGPYEIIERLGGGGMGEVYLARDQRLARLVALKILPAYFVSDAERLRRFQIEARAASALNHANILTVYEFGESDDTHYIATEYIDGRTIRELIAGESLTIADTFDIAGQLLHGLSAAHAAGIVHRDIKPDNVMRRKDGEIKILDFGIAKLIEDANSDVSLLTSRATSRTEVGAVLGTIGYVSPEQARGLAVDERTDIWSAGVVLYEMLAGRRPFSGATNADTIVSILERTPAPLFGDEPKARPLKMLQRIVGKALSKDAGARYQTAAEMLSDLTEVETEMAAGSRKNGGINAETTLVELRELAEVRASASRFALSIATLAVLALVVIAGTVLYRRSVARRSIPPPVPTVYAQMNEAQQLQFINEQEQRVSAMMGERPVKLNDEALRAIKVVVDRYMAPPQPGEPSLSEIYARAPAYLPVIANEFNARRIPIVVGIYLPVIESAYQPCFENVAGAKGLFQFMPATAEHYGVARADMCDVNKMAPAAAHYIADRMAELGDDSQSMTLVLLSYNRGAQSVLEELRLLRETDVHYERNFWTLYANRDKLDQTFRNESAYYVPAFFAAAIIGENPTAFGLNMQPLSTQVPNRER